MSKPTEDGNERRLQTRQLGYWTGEFGDAYIDRNDGRLHDLRRPFFEGLLKQIPGTRSVLEVGCNVAWNLKMLGDIDPALTLAGIEPNARAVRMARGRYPHFDIREGSIFALPFEDGCFDIVMTVGVLIHIAPPDLPAALAEMHRVSRRYLLTVEYFSEEPVVVPYRGLPDALFKRDWLQAWRAVAPGLGIVWSGELNKGRGFDDCRFWLLEKE
jgi:pseudaminic acid biosynthesis-associated methylase